MCLKRKNKQNPVNKRERCLTEAPEKNLFPEERQ